MGKGYTRAYRKIWDNPVLAEPGVPFTRVEAWIYITNRLAAGAPWDGLNRGEFRASIRYLAGKFNWSKGKTERFIADLLAPDPETGAPMLEKVAGSPGQSAGQSAGHFKVYNYEVYNPTRDTERDTERDNINKEYINNEIIKPLPAPPAAGPAGSQGGLFKIEKAGAPRVTAETINAAILLEIYQEENQVLPAVDKNGFTKGRRSKARTRINQADRDGCLEAYICDFRNAVKKAQEVPFLRGAGKKGWKANFTWFIENHENVYKVLEGQYDHLVAGDPEEERIRADLAVGAARPGWKPRDPSKECPELAEPFEPQKWDLERWVESARRYGIEAAIKTRDSRGLKWPRRSELLVAMGKPSAGIKTAGGFNGGK